MSIGSDISREGRSVQEDVSGVLLTLKRTGAAYLALVEPTTSEGGEMVLHREEAAGDTITITKAALGSEVIKPGDYFTNDDFSFRVLTVVNSAADFCVRLRCETTPIA